MKKQIPDPAPGSGDPAEEGPKKTGDPKRDAELKKKQEEDQKNKDENVKKKRDAEQKGKDSEKSAKE